MTDGPDHHRPAPPPPGTGGRRAPARGLRIGVALVVGALVLGAAGPALLYLTAERGRFGAVPDPCPLLEARAAAALGPAARVRPSTESVPDTARRCEATADPARDDAPGVELEVVRWRPPTFARDLASVSAGIRAMAGSDTVAVPGLGDEAYALPGLGWLTVRVSNVSLRFTANVELLVTGRLDDIQAVLRQLAAGAVERLPT